MNEQRLAEIQHRVTKQRVTFNDVTDLIQAVRDEHKKVEHLKNALHELNAMIIHDNTSNEKLGEVISKAVHGLVTGRLNV